MDGRIMQVPIYARDIILPSIILPVFTLIPCQSLNGKKSLQARQLFLQIHPNVPRRFMVSEKLFFLS